MTLEELDRKVATMETKLSERWKFAGEREQALKDALEKCNEQISEIGKGSPLPRWVTSLIAGALILSVTSLGAFVFGYGRLTTSVDNLADKTIPALAKQIEDSNNQAEENFKYLRGKVDRLYGAPGGGS